MSRFRRVLVRLIVPLALVAVAATSNGRVSVQGWAGAAAVWVAGVLIFDLVNAADVESTAAIPAWNLSRKRTPQVAPQVPQYMGAVSHLLATSALTARAHVNSLQPRLELLAAHYARLRLGLELDRDRAEVIAALGDVAWLIDPDIKDRAPTTAEIDQFLDVVLADSAPTIPPNANNGATP